MKAPPAEAGQAAKGEGASGKQGGGASGKQGGGVASMKQGAGAGKVSKPQDFVRVYDILLQVNNSEKELAMKMGLEPFRRLLP